MKAHCKLYIYIYRGVEWFDRTPQKFLPDIYLKMKPAAGVEGMFGAFFNQTGTCALSSMVNMHAGDAQ